MPTWNGKICIIIDALLKM
uniref:Uncharacterized protein n=1 Tax=Rhizophora mucronata TaxID=61149 RepID=A0A2P2MD67_RHIMU